MTMTQCIKCKNSNPQCRESFVLYYCALSAVNELAMDANRDSRFFKDNPREYSFEIKCSHFEPKGVNNE